MLQACPIVRIHQSYAPIAVSLLSQLPYQAQWTNFDNLDWNRCLSNRYTGKPYMRDTGVSWNETDIKSREIWEVNTNNIISMVRPQAKSDPE